MSDLAAALMVAIRVHAGQVDKQSEPYLLHVLRVVEAVSDEAKPVAALHDVLEDGGEYLEPSCAAILDGEELSALNWLTRGDGEEYGTYLKWISEAPGRQGRIAREVKLATLRDNLARIPTPEAYNREMHDRHADTISSWPEWRHVWGSLKARYEKAIVVLEAAGSSPEHEREHKNEP